MKKILILTAVAVMLSSVGCAKKVKKNTPEIPSEPKIVEINQLVYKQEHLSFPEDMEQRMGLYYHDGVKFIYKSKNDEIKVMSYDENMNETGAVVITDSNDVPHDAYFCTKPDGRIIMLYIHTDYSSEEITDYDDFAKNAVVTLEIRTYSPDGELIGTQEIDGFHNYNDFGYIDGFYEYGENYVVSFSEGFSLVMADGKIFNTNNTKQDILFATDTEGKTYACDRNRYSLSEGLSVNTGNSKEYGKYIYRTGSVFRGESDFKLFFVMNEGIYGIDCNDKFTQILDFTDSDISPSGILYACYGGDGKFIVCGESQTLADGTFFDMLTIRPDDYDAENKKLITLGCTEYSDCAEETAEMFNKDNDLYKVSVHPYKDTDNLSRDIISGDAPDLFAYQDASFMYRYANSGTLADIYDYMEKNDGIKQDDILENVLQAYEYKGGLYGIPAGFSLSDAFIANSDVISRDYSYWNYDEFFDTVENMPEDMYLSSKNSMLTYRDGVFGRFCLEEYGNWVDYDNFTCNFNSEEFINLLNFCNTVRINENYYSEEMNKMSDKEARAMNRQEDISVLNEKSLFGNYSEHINDFGEIISIVKQNGLYLNGNYTYLISPSDDRTGTISPTNDMCFSIIDNTDCPEGAWDFMNYVLSPYFQNNCKYLSHCFTTNKKSFSYKLNKELNQYRKQFQLSLDPTEDTMFTFETMGTEWINKPITDEDVEYITDFISHFSKVSVADRNIQDIISEECEKFRNGEITAETCAETIQNSVSEYLNKQKQS